MLVAAGVCAILSVICLCLFCGFSILHVAMQLQRREIVLKYNKAVLAKLITASIAGTHMYYNSTKYLDAILSDNFHARISANLDLALNFFTYHPFSVVCTVGAVIMGAVHFAVGGGNTGLAYDTGVCYYLQVSCYEENCHI